MENTYGEFQGTELDPSLDFDFDEDDDDLVPILGLAAIVAAVVGGILVLLGRRRKEPTAMELAQQILERAGKEGGKGVKAAAKAAGDADLRGMLDDAVKRARKASGDSNLSDLLSEARGKVGGLDVGGAGKGAMAAVGGLGAASVLREALDKVRDVASNIDVSGVADTAREAGKRVSDVRPGDIDTAKAGKLLDDLREKLVEAIDSVRSDVAPKATETLTGTVFPAAQGAVAGVVQRVQEDVLPGAQERASSIVGQFDAGPRARKAATMAAAGAGSLSGLLRTVGMAVVERVMQDILPEAGKVSKKAVRAAREDVIPAAAERAGEAAQLVRDDVLPRVGEAAAQTPGMLAEVLAMARERVGEAIDKAGPVVSDAAQLGVHGAGAVGAGLKRGGAGVTGAVGSVGKGVGGAVGSAVDATTSAARETSRIFFWLSLLGALILTVFVPDKEKQEEIWANLRQFITEVREMWRDLQGPDYELDVAEGDSTL